MNGILTAHWVAAVLTGLYGLISLAGGITGYITKHSTMSLVAGVVSGILLLLCAVGVIRLSPFWSLIGAIILALLLAGRFTGQLVTKASEMTELLRITAIVMVVGGVIVIIAAVVALLTEARPPSIP
jgi:uncharacterized membrane protein (UPF0136 family)